MAKPYSVSHLICTGPATSAITLHRRIGARSTSETSISVEPHRSPSRLEADRLASQVLSQQPLRTAPAVYSTAGSTYVALQGPGVSDNRPCWRGRSRRRGAACAGAPSFQGRRQPLRPLDHPGKASGRERGSPLADEDKRRRLALQWSRRRARSSSPRRGGAGRVLDPPHVQDGAVEVDLVPTQAQASAARSPCRKARRNMVASW
jgi:hypothetical protein